MSNTLIALAALAVLAGALLVESIATCQFIIPDRVKRASEGMNRLLLLIPALAVPVFAVLFLFVLKGRFYERLCHATFLLALWLYAARYCWFLLAYHKSFLSLSSVYYHLFFILCLPIVAIDLTPLDRYVETVYPLLGPASILAGAGLLLVFYVAAFFTTCANKTNVSEPFNWPLWFNILGIVVSILVILVGVIYRLVW
jgi:hypothetical protein